MSYLTTMNKLALLNALYKYYYKTSNKKLFTGVVIKVACMMYNEGIEYNDIYDLFYEFGLSYNILDMIFNNSSYREVYNKSLPDLVQTLTFDVNIIQCTNILSNKVNEIMKTKKQRKQYNKKYNKNTSYSENNAPYIKAFLNDNLIK